MAAEEPQVPLEVNALLTFRDEQGQEWLAAAVIDDLHRYEGGEVVESITVEATKDRAFMLHGLSIVARS